MEPDLTPLAYGLLAGITVLIGVLFMYYAKRRLNDGLLGVLQAMAGGILAYLALETGVAAMEYVESLAAWETVGEFLLASIATTLAFLGTFLVLTKVENAAIRGGWRQSMAIAFVIAAAFGVHNVGEGFAIAASMLTGAVGSAILFTIGFAIHNATEGFAIVGPLLTDRGVAIRPQSLLLLALIAGLPTVAGVSVYYVGAVHGLFISILNTVANASIVYALLHVNLGALAKLGGVSSPKFWTALTLGVAIAYTTESLLMLAGL
ncbi:MAG: ZIP family metal transporter [Pyrobaculum sp.]